jgi:hypothetical protein
MSDEHICLDGFLDNDPDNPRPCPICKPWLAACPTCGRDWRACRRILGGCCGACPHTRPDLRRRRTT